MISRPASSRTSPTGRGPRPRRCGTAIRSTSCPITMPTGARTSGLSISPPASSARSRISPTTTSISHSLGRQRHHCSSRAASCTCWICRAEQLHKLDVRCRTTARARGPRLVDAQQCIREKDAAQNTDYDIAPNGNRAVFSARGDLFTLPAEYGSTRNLTETSNADEDHPAWSPDGKPIAYTTDVSGAQQVAVRPAEGGAERILTHFARGYLLSAAVVARRRSAGVLRQRASPVDRRPQGEAPQQIARTPTTRSTYQLLARRALARLQHHGREPADRHLALQSRSHQATRVSARRRNDYSPVFDPDGQHLLLHLHAPRKSVLQRGGVRRREPQERWHLHRHTERGPLAVRAAIGRGGGPPEEEQTKEREQTSPGTGREARASKEARRQADGDRPRGLMARAVPLPIPAATSPG